MNFELMEALRVIEREKGIHFEILLEALANALVTAYKRMPNAAEEALVEIDAESGEIRVVAQELDEDGGVVLLGGLSKLLRQGDDPVGRLYVPVDGFERSMFANPAERRVEGQRELAQRPIPGPEGRQHHPLPPRLCQPRENAGGDE